MSQDMSQNKSTPKLHIEGDWKAEAQAEKERLVEEESAGAAPKLHVDSGWKAEAQAERERLAAVEAKREKARKEEGHGALPEASFKSLMSVLASQAIMGLGAVTDPQTGGVVIDLETAKFSIDLLDVLEKKSKGNLTDEEARDLRQLTADLRSRFVQITQLLAQQGGGMPKGRPPQAKHPH